MAQPQHFGYPVVPVQVLRINVQEVPGSKGPSWGMEDVEGLVDELTQLAKALVY